MARVVVSSLPVCITLHNGLSQYLLLRPDTGIGMNAAELTTNLVMSLVILRSVSVTQYLNT